MRKQRHQVDGGPARFIRWKRRTVLTVRGGRENVCARVGDDEAWRLLEHPTNGLFNSPSHEQHRNLWHFEPVHFLVKPQTRACVVGVGLAGRHSAVRPDFVGRWIRRVDGHGFGKQATPFEASLFDRRVNDWRRFQCGFCGCPFEAEESPIATPTQRLSSPARHPV